MESLDTPESSSIERVEYESISGELHVYFRTSGMYSYEGVPQEVWQELVQAESKGQFVNFSIKPHYRHHR